MDTAAWRTLCDQIPPGATPRELDAALASTEVGSLSEDDRAALWLYGWSRYQRDRNANRAPATGDQRS